MVHTNSGIGLRPGRSFGRRLRRSLSLVLALVLLLAVSLPTSVFADVGTPSDPDTLNPYLEAQFIKYDKGSATEISDPSEIKAGDCFTMVVKIHGTGETLGTTGYKISFNGNVVKLVNKTTDAEDVTADAMGAKTITNYLTELKDDMAGANGETIPYYIQLASKIYLPNETNGMVGKVEGQFGIDGMKLNDNYGPLAHYPLPKEMQENGQIISTARFKAISNENPEFAFVNVGTYTCTDDKIGQKFSMGGESGTKPMGTPVVQAILGAPKPPATPKVTAQAKSATEIELSWEAVSGADSYEITGNGATTTQSELTKTFKGLTKGTEYTFSVKAHNELGDSVAGTATAKTWSEPKAPGSVTGSMAAEENALRFTWTGPADNGGTPVTGYRLTVTDAETGQTVGEPIKLGASEMEQTVTDLTEGKQYKAKVEAENAVGFGAAAESAPVTVVNAISAAAPIFSTDLSTEPINKEYGDKLSLTVAADVADKAAEEAKGAYTITYQWYEAKNAAGADAEKIEGATAATYETKVKAGTRYFYCVANNHNDLKLVTDKAGEKDAQSQSSIATVNTTAKNLNVSGVTVNKTATMYKNTALKLSDLLTLDAATAGSVPGETVDQVLDVAAGKVSDGAIVTFRKSTDPATAAAISYADVIKTNGTYNYTVAIPQESSSTNYILSGAIAGEGTLTVKTKSSGGGGGGGGGSSSGGSTATTTGTDVKKVISSSGSASISASELKNAKSVEAKNSQITVSLNQQAVNALDKTTGLIIKTEKKSGTTLNDTAKELLGSRPVFDVTATQNGKAVTDFGSGTVTISIAYTPTGSEDTAKLFLYYINDKGEAEKVSGSKYDGSLKAVTGQTSHLSSYAVGYDKDAAGTSTPVTPGSAGLFRDVSSSDWFYTAVMDLAGREILSGVPDEDAKGNPIGTYTFRPQNNVTRAEFVTMLAKAAGANLSQYSANTFNDVSANDWYAGAVDWASSLGVASGTGDGSFSPNANITRQDMAVMVSRYLSNVTKTTLTAKNEKITFTDGAQIAEYADSAVETMQTAGIISGTPNEDAKGNPIGTYQFRPFANASRAEAAAILNGLLNALQ